MLFLEKQPPPPTEKQLLCLKNFLGQIREIYMTINTSQIDFRVVSTLAAKNIRTY